MFSHPPREANFHFTAAEVMCAAEQQLLAAGGIEESLYVTVKVTLDEEGKPLIDAWQVTKQCMEMVAEGALQGGPHPGMCLVNPTFTAIVEGKPASEVDNNFFLSRVPIGSHESIFIATFPRINRHENTQSAADIKRQLTK